MTNSTTKRPDWAILTIITSGMGAGPLLNFGLASTSALIITEFGITSAEFGAILTVVFVAAAVVSLGLGALADRVSARTQFVILFGGAAASIALAGLAPTYGFLLATAVLSGVSQAMSNPTTNRAVTALAPPGKRTGWIGVKQSGVQVSQFVSGLIYPPLTLAFGWTGAALIVSGLCVVLLLGALVLVPDWTRTGTAAGASGAGRASGTRHRRDPETNPLGLGTPGEASIGNAEADFSLTTGSIPVISAEEAEQARAAKPSDPARPDIPARTLWLIVGLLAGVSFLSGFGMMSTNGYLALFAVNEFGYTLVLGGIVVAVGGAIGIVSRIWWAGQLSRGAGAGPLLVIMSLGAILAGVLLVLAQVLGASAFIWLAVAVHGISVLGANVVINASVVRIVGPSKLGLATGLTATGMYLGFATGPIAAGALIDSPLGFLGGWGMLIAVYALCLVVSMVFSRVTRPYRKPKP